MLNFKKFEFIFSAMKLVSTRKVNKKHYSEKKKQTTIIVSNMLHPGKKKKKEEITVGRKTLTNYNR